MKKIVLLLAIVTFLIGGSTYAQVNSVEKDALINPKKHSTSNKLIKDKKVKHPSKKMEEPVNTNANNPNAPIIVFDKLEHDYGTIKQHADGACDFTFTNEGKEPLILSNVRSSCGCTIPTWPKQPILPGKSETIHVVYDTKRVGAFKKRVYIYSNAKKGTVNLLIKGLVERDPNTPVKTSTKKKEVKKSLGTHK